MVESSYFMTYFVLSDQRSRSNNTENIIDALLRGDIPLNSSGMDQ
jgi:hypothetical protein